MPNRFINHLPPTDSGAGLKLTAEQEEMCRVVYKLSEDDPEIYVFYSLWDPDKNYSDEYIIVPIRSTDFKIVTKPNGHEFANIIDSSSDPHPTSGSWLQMFRDNGIKCDQCMTDGKFYDPSDGHEFTDKETGHDLSCNNDHMKGGHVFPGRINYKFKKEDHQTVELIPICSHHNSYTLGQGSGNGTGFFMKLKCSAKIIELENYMSAKAIEKHDE